MSLLTILLKIFICSSVLYGYYLLLLRNKRFHRYNRFYLLASVLISLAFPFVNIEVDASKHINNYPTVVQVFQTISVSDWEGNTEQVDANNFWQSLINIKTLVLLLYTLVAGFLIVVFFKSLLYIRFIARKYKHEKIGKLRLYDTNEPGTPFSFFKLIFWNAAIQFNSKKGQQIFRHEMFHVQQKHSGDTVFMQIICCFCWFNPVFFMIRKELKTIHEFLADQYAISDSDRYAYAEMLVLESIRFKQSPIVHPFYTNQIKRRIAMITKFSQKKYGYWSRIMTLPLVICLFCFVTLKAQQSESKKPTMLMLSEPENSVTPAQKKITVVIDAGHGGDTKGSISPGEQKHFEKDLNLAIARKIKELSSFYNVNVIMTRESDMNVTNIDRVNMLTETPYDVFVSIHMAAMPPSRPGPNKPYELNFSNRNGMEVYISSSNNKTVEQSTLLASALISSLKEMYTVKPAVIKRSWGTIYVLDNVKKPSALVECGYITNENDLKFALQEENQQKIAEKILQGIVAYSNKPE